MNMDLLSGSLEEGFYTVISQFADFLPQISYHAASFSEGFVLSK